VPSSPQSESRLYELFAPGQRYTIRRPLGRGGMGTVNAAYDAERACEVALKRLRTADPRGVMRFKNEFRLVQNLEHPNLVRLFDLAEAGGEWFLTMELLDGSDLLGYVHNTRGRRPTAPPLLPNLPVGNLESTPPAAGSGRSVVVTWPAPYDEQRLRYAFGELAVGLSALHDAGLLHRDVKASNVMVTSDERVVLLDFGLATELDLEQRSTEGHLLGTAAYMAPEQATAATPNPAADWYSFGILLFRALTGTFPFNGTSVEILMQKQVKEPPSPRQLVPEVPEDLDRLCVELLRFDPTTRPRGSTVLAAFGVDQRPSGPVSLRSQLTETRAFIGRDRELGELDALAARVGDHEPSLAYIHGPSGMGKSALAARFLDALEARRDDVIVLRGRCFENEAVPFKALDGVIDTLAAALRQLDSADRHAVLPRRAALLPRLFPVLGRVDAIACAPPLAKPPADRHQERRWAFLALRDLLSQLTERWPVVVAIDDLQWTDRDSLELLGALLAPSEDRPALLVVATSRDPSPPQLRESPDLCWHSIPVGPLDSSAATRLAAELLGQACERDEAVEIAQEAHGHPLFVAELARFAAVRDRNATPLSLDGAIWDRITQLPEGPRRVLELLSLATSPLPPDAIELAARIDPQELARALALLRVADLIRSAGGPSSARVIPYHDRVREAVARHLSAEQIRAGHGQLALALEVVAATPAESIAHHALAAGDIEKAVDCFERAARAASEGMAFDRAATLYQRVLELAELPAVRRSAIHSAIGDAFAHAGRGRDAADAYMTAIEGAERAEAVRLRNLAAGHLLRSGHITEGLAGLEAVLREVGLELPKSRTGAAFGYLWQRGLLRLRQARSQLKSRSELAPAAIIRVDAISGAAEGMSWIDGVRSAPLMVRWQRACFELGEPIRVAKAYGLEAYITSLAGVKAAARTRAALERARQIAQRVESPYLDGYLEGVDAMVAQNESRFGEVAPLAETAIRTLEQCGDVAHWELMTVRVFSLWGLFFEGEHRAAMAGARQLLADANERSDRWLSSQLRILIAQYARLSSDDDLESAARAADEALAPWADRDFGFIHYNWLSARSMVALSRGDGSAALALLRRHRADLRRSGSTRIEILRNFIGRLEAAAHLGAYDNDGDDSHLRATRHAARRLLRVKAPWPRAEGKALLAAIAMRTGDLDSAVALLREAADLYNEAGVVGPSYQAHWQRGHIIGGDEGQGLCDRAHAFFDEQELGFPLGFMRCSGYPDPA